jgi:hypothetical protein
MSGRTGKEAAAPEGRLRFPAQFQHCIINNYFARLTKRHWLFARSSFRGEALSAKGDTRRFDSSRYLGTRLLTLAEMVLDVPLLRGFASPKAIS